MEIGEDEDKLNAFRDTGSEAAETTVLHLENYGHSGVDVPPRNSKRKQGLVNDGGLGPKRKCNKNIVDEDALVVPPEAESVDMSTFSDSEIEAQKHLASDYDCLCDKAVESRDTVVEKLPENDVENPRCKEGCAERDDRCGALDVNFGQRVKFELTKTPNYSEKSYSSAGEGQASDGGLAVSEATPVRSHMIDGSYSSLGVKRAKLTVDEDQPSVHITYNNLRRASKDKLEELLQQWSQWDAKCGSSPLDIGDMLVSGEETFFPALNVGLEKGSAVSFWLDNLSTSQQSKPFIPFDSKSVPLYDRGYASGLTLVDGLSNPERGLTIVDDASRCFNCGSYNHSLRECPKPHDITAISNSRKQHKSRRNQNHNSRNSARYYQNTPGGKFDGLRPGTLDSETRKVLGLSELDPPPWLSRMREIGYPPGYLDKDESSGITIYADEEIAVEKEGKMTETNHQPKVKRKKMVEFPGINGPIPKNADERAWIVPPVSLHHPSSLHHHGSWPPPRRLSFSDDIGRSHHREQGCFWDFGVEGPHGSPYYDYSFEPPHRSPYYDYSFEGPRGSSYYDYSMSRFSPPDNIYHSSYHASEYTSPTLARYQFGSSRWSAFR